MLLGQGFWSGLGFTRTKTRPLVEMLTLATLPVHRFQWPGQHSSPHLPLNISSRMIKSILLKFGVLLSHHYTDKIKKGAVLVKYFTFSGSEWKMATTISHIADHNVQCPLTAIVQQLWCLDVRLGGRGFYPSSGGHILGGGENTKGPYTM